MSETVRDIIIRCRTNEAGDNELEVVDPTTGATTLQLTWGELIEQIASIFPPYLRRPHYRMRTKEEWDEQGRLRS